MLESCLNPEKPVFKQGSYKFKTPDGLREIEVTCSNPSNTGTASACMVIRDLSIPKPPFNAMTHLNDLGWNIVEWVVISADTTPIP